MEIQYTKRRITAGGFNSGLGEVLGPYSSFLGQFLFIEANCFFGVLPPFAMLNKTLMKGKIFSTHNTILEWTPMRISRLDYEELQKSIRKNPQWGGEVDEGFKGSRKYWERWAILRSLEKMPMLAVPV